MKRSDKVALLTKIVQGNVDPATIKRLMNPAPKEASGVLIIPGDGPAPDDTVRATLTFSNGNTKQQALTYQQFEQLPESTNKILFVLPDNHR
ncbi:hypothetical protein [Larkinella punicea]|uniref:Uncharacterized protein n=1 Tax=Larkinella punicea TaxID=2315727 RepID=A0A368JNZ2_9BACT|nr:hypothetical protein [Larkinella punicea]RCR68313.1 hypothetical protein DUE52_18125 [Larkinella punicea]